MVGYYDLTRRPIRESFPEIALVWSILERDMNRSVVTS
jgi:hypothetical protein